MAVFGGESSFILFLSLFFIYKWWGGGGGSVVHSNVKLVRKLCSLMVVGTSM